jgi:hypothetical protein
LDKTQKRLLIFIEGLNENREFVKAFNADSERLQNPLITLILSLTSFSVRDILFDETGNPTYAARSVGVTKNELSILEVNPSTLTSRLALIPVGPYTNEEREQAYKTYSEALDVRVPSDHKPTCEPLLLRNAMEIYQQNTLPAVLTAQAILERTIVEKIQRAREISAFTGRSIITELAHRLCTGQDVTDFWLYDSCPCAEGLFEAAVLVRRGGCSVDFYVSSERSFVFAYWVRHWNDILRRSAEIFRDEIVFASNHDPALEAMRWFMVQRENLDVLARAGETLAKVEDTTTRKAIALCLCDFVATIDAGELFEIVEHDDCRRALNDVLYANRAESTLFSETLVKMIEDEAEQFEVRRVSAIGLAVFDPERCLGILTKIVGGCDLQREPILIDALEPGFRRAVDEILESYYNTRDYMCPSRLDHLEGDEEESLEEYDRLCRTCIPAIQLFSSVRESSKLEELLVKLNPHHESVRRRADPRMQIAFDFKQTKPAE